jgi:transposase
MGELTKIDFSPRGRAILSKPIVIEMGALYPGMTIREIAASYGLSINTVQKVINGTSWGWVEGAQPIVRERAPYKKKLSVEVIRYIREQYPKKTPIQLGYELGIPTSLVTMTIKRMIYKDVE